MADRIRADIQFADVDMAMKTVANSKLNIQESNSQGFWIKNKVDVSNKTYRLIYQFRNIVAATTS